MRNSKQRDVAPESFFFSVKPLQSLLATQNLSEVKVFLFQAVDLLTQAVTDFDERGEILHFCLQFFIFFLNLLVHLDCFKELFDLPTHRLLLSAGAARTW